MSSFAQLSDLGPLLIQPLTTPQQARATALLEQAANRIRSYTRRTFTLTTNDVVKLRSVGAKVRLPQTPVVKIDSLALIDWLGNVFPIPTYGFDGIDSIDISFYGAVLNLPEALTFDTTFSGTVQVTYDHGYDTVPQDIIDLNADMVARVFNSPTGGVPGIAGQTVGPFSVRLDASPAAAGQVALTDDDKTILGPYVRRRNAIELR